MSLSFIVFSYSAIRQWKAEMSNSQILIKMKSPIRDAVKNYLADFFC